MTEAITSMERLPPNPGSQMPVVDVRQFIDERRMSSMQWLVLGFCFLLVVADGMDVAVMGFLAPAIGKAWHVSHEVFGMVMGAAPLGLAVGALVAGPLADRYGRKTLLMVSAALFGAFSLASAWAVGIPTLAIFRFLTGLGLGATMPCSTTLLSEYVPQRLRGVLITTMFTGFNLGSALVGFVAAQLIPAWGWPSVLVFVGVVPLVLLPAYLKWLPESVRFMVARGAPAERIARTLTWVCGTTLDKQARFVLREEQAAARAPVVALLDATYRRRTLALWLTYFMGLVTIYLFSSWMPTLITMDGASIAHAANVTALFQLGGTVGALLVGYLMDRYAAVTVISVAYVAGALCIGLLMGLHAASPLFGAAVTAAGFCISGAQTGLNAYAPGCYPTGMRATGVSWMLGIGRFGSIFGSMAGGVFLTLGWSVAAILCVVGIPSLLAALGVQWSRLRIPSTAH